MHVSMWAYVCVCVCVCVRAHIHVHVCARVRKKKLDKKIDKIFFFFGNLLKEDERRAIVAKARKDVPTLWQLYKDR